MDLRITNIGAHSIRFDWYEAPTCYNRSEYVLKFNSSADNTRTMHIHKDSTRYTLGNLEPEMDYTFEFMTIYGNEKSYPIVMRSRTSKHET